MCINFGCYFVPSHDVHVPRSVTAMSNKKCDIFEEAIKSSVCDHDTFVKVKYRK